MDIKGIISKGTFI